MAHLKPATACCAALLMPVPSFAQTAAEFFAKSRITISVGVSAGGNYDLYTRLIARHFGRHLPGAPNVIVQNVPGAGGRKMINALYAIGPHDGSAIGMANQGVVMDQALGDKGLTADVRKIAWIGSPLAETNIIWTWHTHPVKTMAQAREHEVVMGSTGPGSPTFYNPPIINAVLGTKMKVVSGYPGSAELDRAIERGEAGGRAAVGWSSLKITQDWVKSGKVNFLAQMAMKRAADLPDVPLLQEFGRDDRERRTLEFLSYAPSMGRPLVLPPGVPADRISALRNAFEATMKDGEFLGEAAKLQLEITPLTAQELQQIAEKTLTTPADILNVVKAAVQ